MWDFATGSAGLLVAAMNEMLASTEKEEFLNELLKILQENYTIQADKSIILKMPRLIFIAEK